MFTFDQTLVFSVIVLALVLFFRGPWRYEIVALLALLTLTFAGIIPRERAYSGFGHPAVVVVGAILVVSRGLRNSGIVDLIGRWTLRQGNSPTLQVAAISTLVTAISGFISSVGATAILMPVAVQLARKSGRPPSYLLMPLAFGSLLGAMLTLIGSSPNIIIALFRERALGEPFGMFDYTPVGLGVAVTGVLFMSFLGWRLVPERKGLASPEELFRIKEYTSEVRVPEESKLIGKTVFDLEVATGADTTVVALVRGNTRYLVPSSTEVIRADDILIVEADSDSLQELIDISGFELRGSKGSSEEEVGSDEVTLMEVVVMPGSILEERTTRNLSLHWRYGLNLLAVARQGQRLMERLGRIRFMVGDILLLQGRTEMLHEGIQTLGLLPLAGRELRLGQPRHILLAMAIFLAAITSTATNFLSVETAFVSAAVMMILAGLLSLREAYESIEWPVIILLGAMIPVGESLESSGGAELISQGLLHLAEIMPAAGAVGIILVGAMALTPLINNAAAAVLMAPIAIGVAQGLNASPDPFLMAVSIGTSCDFLTPIGHQSNTLVMGPGGYSFSDYWKMGLPLTTIVAVVSFPLILWIWPLGLP